MQEHLVYKDDDSHKFWDVKTEGNRFIVNFGKVGGKGQSQTKEFDSEDECLKEAGKLIAEKRKKGYKECISGPLWEIMDSGYLESSLAALEKNYFNPRSEFSQKDKPIEHFYLYVLEWPDIFINRPRDGGNGDDDEDNESDEYVIEMNRDAMQKKLLNFHGTKIEDHEECDTDWGEECANLAAGQLYDYLGAGHFDSLDDPLKISFANAPLSKNKEFSKAEIARFKGLYSEGHYTLTQAVFYYRLAARIAKAMRNDSRYSIAENADFSACIHDTTLDSGEEKFALLYRMAQEYSDKPIGEYLAWFGII